MSVRVASSGVLLFAGARSLLLPGSSCFHPIGPRRFPVTRLLAVFVVLRSGSCLLQAYFQSVGRTGTNAILRAVWVVLLVASSDGGSGGCRGGGIQVVVAAVILAAQVIVSRMIGGTSVRDFLADVFRPVLACVVAGALVLLLQAAMPDGWLSDVVGRSPRYRRSLRGLYVALLLCHRADGPRRLRRFRASVRPEGSAVDPRADGGVAHGL